MMAGASQGGRKLPQIEHKQVIYSPLSRHFERDGFTVRVQIYRLADEPGWVLEVEDEENASTVWDEPFPTDEAAWEEFLRTIQKEGVRSFL